MRILSGIALAMLVTAGSAEAKDEPAALTQKIICKRVFDADTGSHFQSSKRVCHTALEWKEIEDGTARTLQTIRDNGGASGTTSAGGFGGTPQ